MFSCIDAFLYLLLDPIRVYYSLCYIVENGNGLIGSISGDFLLFLGFALLPNADVEPYIITSLTNDKELKTRFGWPGRRSFTKILEPVAKISTMFIQISALSCFHTIIGVNMNSGTLQLLCDRGATVRKQCSLITTTTNQYLP